MKENNVFRSENASQKLYRSSDVIKFFLIKIIFNCGNTTTPHLNNENSCSVDFIENLLNNIKVKLESDLFI